MKNFYKKGMSVVEILVVVAIMALTVSVAIPQFSKMRQNQAMKSAVSDILSSLSKARSQTLASLDSSSFGVHFEADKVVLFKGITFSSNDINNEVLNIISPVTISNISLTGGAVNIYFNKLNGSPSVYGTVTVETNGGLNKIITIYPTGLVSLN